MTEEQRREPGAPARDRSNHEDTPLVHRLRDRVKGSGSQHAQPQGVATRNTWWYVEERQRRGWVRCGLEA